jgi:23S rRNA (adenine-N6)-dimethyltransferase
VRGALIAPGDVVLEIGAGDGRLTAELARRARGVVAVELDPVSVDRLRARFRGDRRVRVVHADIRDVPLPREPFRAFGNIPFGVTNAVLRRLLDDPSVPLTRIDLILQLEAARKRAEVWPSTALSLGWLPWWDLSIVRRLPRTGFDPAPTVDAAMLRGVPRRPPLLDTTRRSSFVGLVRFGFTRPTIAMPRALRGVLPPLTWKRLARERGLPLDATPRELDVWDWIAVFGAVDASVTPRRAAPRRSRPRTGDTRRTRS